MLSFMLSTQSLLQAHLPLSRQLYLSINHLQTAAAAAAADAAGAVAVHDAPPSRIRQ